MVPEAHVHMPKSHPAVFPLAGGEPEGDRQEQQAQQEDLDPAERGAADHERDAKGVAGDRRQMASAASDRASFLRIA